MPKLQLVSHTVEPAGTLADVPEGEWWLDMEGDPVQHAQGKVIWYESRNRTFSLSHVKPEHTKVTRKLCDPIELIWE